MTEPQPLGFDPMAVVAAAPAMRRVDSDGAVIIGPMPWQLPREMRRTLADGSMGYDLMSAFGALWGSASMLYSQLQPLQAVAASLPGIVSHSDEVHTELQQGLDAIRTAVGSVQTAAQSLTTSLGPISQTAAQAYAAAAVANSKATALDARIAALEAREVRLYRAVGDLPTVALGASTTRLCPWQGDPPSPLPSPRQCTVIQIAGTAATLTPTAVSAAGVTVSVRSANALLTAPNALQVVAATYA